MSRCELVNTRGINGMLHLLQLVYYTEVVDKPLSMLMVGEPGVGKSMILTNFKYEKSLIVNDLTGRGMEDLVEMEFKKRPRGFVVCPDMLKPLSRRQSGDSLIFLLNILSEEGISRIKRYDKDIEYPEPVFYGFIGAITTMGFNKYSEKFAGAGYTSRNLISSYSYTHETASWVQDQIFHNEQVREYVVARPTPKEIKIDVKMVNSLKKVADALSYCRGDAVVLGDTLSFRATKHIRALVLAQSLIDGVDEVGYEQLCSVACILPFLLGVKFKALRMEYASDDDYYTMRALLLKEDYERKEASIDKLLKVGILDIEDNGKGSYLKIRGKNVETKNSRL